ncbi:hypothetical protein [Brevibacillus choshinensis]|uniref:Uncharacterized protein n=1 Tax=Brevibacillus choshinensis TaxID=54911 RepID=A0ABX7FQR0_BRECH|nr:hypothetical protein [Brevibacillus choshinensis]QRG68584.1 hypothetical protein JNE38_05370 [Brevibacillus choshinensis]
MGILIGIGIYAFAAFIAYLVIKTAVKHGIDESNRAYEIQKLQKEILEELKKQNT